MDLDCRRVDLGRNERLVLARGLRSTEIARLSTERVLDRRLLDKALRRERERWRRMGKRGGRVAGGAFDSACGAKAT